MALVMGLQQALVCSIEGSGGQRGRFIQVLRSLV